MDKKYITKTILAILLSISMVLCQGLIKTSHASAKITPVILLSDYQKEMKLAKNTLYLHTHQMEEFPNSAVQIKKLPLLTSTAKL